MTYYIVSVLLLFVYLFLRGIVYMRTHLSYNAKQRFLNFLTGFFGVFNDKR